MSLVSSHSLSLRACKRYDMALCWVMPEDCRKVHIHTYLPDWRYLSDDHQVRYVAELLQANMSAYQTSRRVPVSCCLYL